MFQPAVNQVLTVDGSAYRFAEHPAAPGIPYGQEGRSAVVYQLLTEAGERRALKVFKPRHRVPALVSLADRIASLADLPGLEVCRRMVLSARRHGDLLQEHPELTYAVLMPWIDGPTWTEILQRKGGDGLPPLRPADCLALARALAELLAAMEEQCLAHCDLSGPNVLLPILASGRSQGSEAPGLAHGSRPSPAVALVDVEQIFAPGLARPELLPGGSPGYAHRTAPEGAWSSAADRFAGAILLAEMLSACELGVCRAAWGESYFDPAEMQQASRRFDILTAALAGRWGAAVAGLLQRAWRSDTLAECATFGEWLVALPREVRAEAIPGAAGADALGLALTRARRAEGAGDLASALAEYETAQRMASDPALRDELDRIVVSLRERQAPPQEGKSRAALARSHEAAGRWGAAAATYAELVREAADPSLRERWKAEVDRCREEQRVSNLFDRARDAMRRGDWTAAGELLDEVIRLRPDFRKGTQVAEALRADVRRREGRPLHGARQRSRRLRLALALAAGIVAVGLALAAGWIGSRLGQEKREAQAQATGTAQAVLRLTAEAEERSTAVALTAAQASWQTEAASLVAQLTSAPATATAGAQETAAARGLQAQPGEAATATPTPTRIPTSTPSGPSPAPEVSPTVTAVPSATPTRRGAGTATATTSPLVPVLVSPQEGAEAQGTETFVWQWKGRQLAANEGFEVRIWKDGQPDHYGAADPTRQTQITIGLAGAEGVRRGGPGWYNWTVALVQISPYRSLGPEAAPRRLWIALAETPPPATATRAATSTPTPTRTATRTATATPTRTLPPLPTVTPITTETPTDTPEPTATATP